MYSPAIGIPLFRTLQAHDFVSGAQQRRHERRTHESARTRYSDSHTAILLFLFDVAFEGAMHFVVLAGVIQIRLSDSGVAEPTRFVLSFREFRGPGRKRHEEQGY